MSAKLEDLIREELESVAEELDIPRQLIPELIALMQRYPTLEGQGRRADLVNDLKKILSHAQREGAIPDA